ncbi:MAG: hypothetical protein FJ395_00335 [Verrucomicrobia bacterium]|nr:hypothetical protein [Verrucomicrobiota bacterium]
MATYKAEFPTHKRPTTSVSLAIMLGGGLALALVIFGALWPLPANSFVRDVFIGHAAEAALKEGKPNWDPNNAVFTFLITFMWAVSVVGIILKMLRVRKERARTEGEVVPANLNLRNMEEVVMAFERLTANTELTESICYTRVTRVLSVYVNTQSSDRAADMAKEESELDAAASDTSFRLNRLFIWALPVLGFIGTVYGVSLAVSNFAGFLQGAVTPEAIKVQVGLITTGLGVAFYTTLLGLIFATIAAFSSLVMEKVEEGMMESIDELTENSLVLRLPTESELTKNAFPIEEMAQAIRQGIESVTAQQKFPIEELAQAIDAGFRRLPNPDRYEEVFTRAITKAGDLINQKYDEFAQNYERRVGELGSQLGVKLEGVANAFHLGTQCLAQQLNEQSQKMGQSLTEMEERQVARMNGLMDEMKRLSLQMPDEFRRAQERYLELQAKTDLKSSDRFQQLSEQIATVSRGQSVQFAEAHEKYLSAIAELDRKEITRWEKMVADFNKLALQLGDTFKQAVSTMDAASANYSGRIQASVDSLNEQLQSIQRIGIEIDKVLRTTQSVETTLRQVGSSDEFRQTLANLRTHLSASDELLRQLSRPRKVVFQETRAED